MKKFLAWALLPISLSTYNDLNAQCTTTNASSCVCEQSGQSDCDLLPDITISWYALENVNGNGSNGPTEYSQSGNGSNNGRLRVSGSTPNIGHGALNVRGVDEDGRRWFKCGTDTFNIQDPSSNQQFSCPNNETAEQLILQRVYHKNGNSMSFTERFAGTMTYHPTHGHNHVDDWATFTLRLEDENEPNPLNWPIVGDGAKVGFCLMDYYSCPQSSAAGHCRTSQEYQGGTALNSSNDFDNYGHGGGSYNCSPISQGISAGYTDLYGEWLDGMWIDIPPGVCNGDYWIVMQVDENDNFLEEDENNNWTAIPYTLTQQEPAGGDFAQISVNGATEICSGTTVQLTASAGNAYSWSTGETTQSILADASGDYSVTVTGQCGVDASAPVSVTVMDAIQPVGAGATLSAPGSASISATGSNVNWYDDQFAGNMLFSGNIFNTPFISSTTSYWAEEISGGGLVTANGGKQDNSGNGSDFDSDQYLYFDAYEPINLVSVKMYAGSAGVRHILCVTAAGDLIDQAYVDVPAGEQTVQLDFDIPAGNGHQITIWDDDSNDDTYIRDAYRNNGGVNFPYALGALGEITSSSAGNAYYYFFYDWEVENIPLYCSSPRTEVTVAVNAGVALSARVILEGPYDEVADLMADDLRNAALVPSNEPYTGMSQFTHVNGGDESVGPGVLDVSGNNAIVDWVFLELRNKNDNTEVLETRSALLQSDGDIVDVDGVSAVQFLSPQDEYFVVIRHRNHLGVMTANAIALSNTPSEFDLSSGSTDTWGTNAQKDLSGTYCMWMGNAFVDQELMYTGGNNDRDPILVSIGGGTPTDTNSGYLLEDCNLDGVVKYTGPANDRDPILVNIGGSVPTQTRHEQLP